MDLNLTEELLELIEERDKAVKYLTARIFDKIKPNVLDTLYELFELPIEDISWEDVQFIEGVLLIICTISYEPNKSTSFIQKLFPPSPIDHLVARTHKLIRIGIPIAYVFGTKEELVEFLHQVADRTFDEKTKDNVEHQSEQEENVRFDTTHLTEEQVQQMLLFGNTKGAKH